MAFHFPQLQRRRMVHLLSSLCLALIPGVSAQAQDYPTRPINFILGYPPGGAGDSVARLVSEKMSETLGQPIIIHHKPSAGAILSAANTVNAPADGYTILLAGNALLTNNPLVHKNLPYDPLKSFDALGTVCIMPLVVLASTNSGITSAEKMIHDVRATPEAFSFGSYGIASSAHFAGEMLNQATGMRMMHVPFNGSAPNMNALIGGHIPLSIDTITAARSFIASGRAVPLLTFSPERLVSLPDVPTTTDIGLDGLVLEAWIAILVKAGTPEPIRKILSEALSQALSHPDVQKGILALGLTPQYENPETVRNRVTRELPLVRDIAGKIGIKAE